MSALSTLWDAHSKPAAHLWEANSKDAAGDRLFLPGVHRLMFFTALDFKAFLTLLQLAVSPVRSITNGDCHLSLPYRKILSHGKKRFMRTHLFRQGSSSRGANRCLMHGAGRPRSGREPSYFATRGGKIVTMSGRTAENTAIIISFFRAELLPPLEHTPMPNGRNDVAYAAHSIVQDVRQNLH